MSLAHLDVGTIFAAMEDLFAGSSPTLISNAQSINIHVVGGRPARWSWVADRRPRIAPNFTDAPTLLCCDTEGLIGWLKAASETPTVVIGQRAAITQWSTALNVPKRAIAVREGDA